MANEDPWAAADAAANSAGQSSVADAYAAPEQASSRLFAEGGSGSPSLINQTHMLGAVRTGVITKAPFDRQRTQNGTNDPLYWPSTGDRKPTTAAVDATSGQRNKPVLDTLIEVETEYSMDVNEATLLGRDEPYEGGARTLFVGKDVKKFKEAIAEAVKSGVKLTSDADMLGKRLTVEVTSVKPNPHGGFPLKEKKYTITNA